MVEMELLGVQVELPSNSPLLLLREMDGQGRVLPVVIDTPEAHAIHRGIEGIRLARPLTHDLLVAMLEELQATVTAVTVTELRGKTFFAEKGKLEGEADSQGCAGSAGRSTYKGGRSRCNLRFKPRRKAARQRSSCSISPTINS